MGRWCCVLDCSESNIKDNFGKKISYHKVPPLEQEGLRKEWLRKIRRRDYFYKPTKNIYVCSKHFKETDFRVDHDNWRNGHRLLIRNAVPTIFKWNFNINRTESLVEPKIANISECASGSTDNGNSVIHNDPEILENNDLNTSSISEFEPEERQFCNSTFINSSDDAKILENADRASNIVGDDSGILQDNSELSVLDKSEDCSCSTSSSLKEENKTLQKIILDLEARVALQVIQLKMKENELQKTKKLLDVEISSSATVKRRLQEISINLDNLKDNDDDIVFYTGLPNYGRLMALYEFLDPGDDGENIILWKGSKQKSKPAANNLNTSSGRPRILPPKDQFLLVLMRLRLGLFNRDLARRFGISMSTVSSICNSWINFMYLQLGQINIWPTREQIDATMPEDFKLRYPSTRVIVDATEIKCETSKSFVLQSGTYSAYKSCTTYKGLIGISPSGTVSFISSLFTGCISDKELTKRSGFLQLNFTPHCSVMADKGFLIEDLLKEINVSLNIPPFLRDKGQFTKEEIAETQSIAALRIHVERRIQRIKGFHIFDRPIPISLSPVINQLWAVCVTLTNFQNPIIKPSNSTLSDEENFDDSLEAPLEI